MRFAAFFAEALSAYKTVLKTVARLPEELLPFGQNDPAGNKVKSRVLHFTYLPRTLRGYIRTKLA